MTVTQTTFVEEATMVEIDKRQDANTGDWLLSISVYTRVGDDVNLTTNHLVYINRFANEPQVQHLDWS